MTMLWIRHGETALNVARVLQPPDTPLSPRGQAQARALASWLAGAGLRAVLCSDLPRAHLTAQIVAAAAGGVPVHTSALLQERNYGDLRGQSYDGLGYDPLSMSEAPPGGESMAQLVQRAGRALREAAALQLRLGGPLAVVSHGQLIQTVLRHHAQLPDGQASPGKLGNTSVCEIDATPPHRVGRLNLTAHLPADLAGDGHGLVGG